MPGCRRDGPRTAAALAVIGALGCAHAPAAAPAAEAPAGPAAGATGSVRVEYLPPKDPRHRELADALRQRDALKAFAEVLGSLRLPRPLTLSLQGCDGVSNAWYSPAKSTVIFCYEFLADIAKHAPQAAKEGVPVEDVRDGALAFFVLHESSHALFDLLSVPLLGHEEDAADSVAAWMLLRAGREVALRSLRGAAWMYLRDSRARKADESDFADVHALDAQRYYNVLCLAYGSDPEFFGNAVKKGRLPQDRAEGCEEEWSQVNYAVKALLLGHVDAEAADRVRARYQKRWGERLEGAR